MAPSSTATPQTPGHRRSATAILKSMVPHRSSHKKATSQPPPPSKPLNTNEPNRGFVGKPQLPPLDPPSGAFFPPLEPPVPPFAQGSNSPRRMHKKSLSSISITSFASKPSKSDNITAPPSPSRTTRASMDIDLSSIFDLVRNSNRGNSALNTANGNGELPSPQKSSLRRGEKKPGKSKSSLDFGILRQKPKDKKTSSPDNTLADSNSKTLFKDKENQRPKTGGGFGLTPSSSAGSGFITEPGAISGSGSHGFSALYALPQDHPHSQQRNSQQGPRQRPLSGFTPRVTPRGSNSSLYQPRTSTSSNTSSSSSRKRQTGSPAKSTEDLMKKYTPTEYDPAKQRQFLAEPTLVPKPHESTSSSRNKQRPKSAFVPPSTSIHSGGFSVAAPRRTSYELRKSMDKRRSEDSKNASPTGSQGSETSGMSGISARSSRSAGLDLEGIDVAFEALLDARGVPSHLRDRMRSLDIRVKQEFIRKEAQMDEKDKRKSVAPPTSSATSGGGIFSRRPQTSHGGKSELRPKSKEGEALKAKALEPAFSPKKARPRSKTFGASKEKESSSHTNGGGPNSPKKSKEITSGDRSLKVKSIVFPPATTSAIPANGPHSPTMVPTLAPEEWVAWLREAGRPKNLGNRVFSEGVGSTAGSGELGMKDVEVAALHKLRLVLRNERLKWVEGFIKMGGMQSVWRVVQRVLGVEWREEHEDLLLHELLLCLKALCTASLGLEQLLDMETTIFPALIELLFDEEKKGPSEFTTRGLIISLLFTHLSAARQAERPERTRRILSYLADKVPNEDKRPIEFIEVAHTSRPYRRWCKEVVNVTKEVFWIFLHGANVITLPQYHTNIEEPYSKTHFPSERPPVPAAPYVGGVEWEATNYLANHLDLLNGCIASLENRDERNRLRLDLRNSGWEKVMGGSLRTCKEKLHAAVHDGLKTWVGAAAADVWEIADVRFGPRIDAPIVVEKRRKKKKKQEDEDKVELPKIDLGSGVGMNVNVGVGVNGTSGGDGWLY